MTKQGLEQQKVLKALAREIKFESVMFADVFGYSTREPLRYYLWMCELNKWLYDTIGFTCIDNLSYDYEHLESMLINNIKELQDINKLPKKEKK